MKGEVYFFLQPLHLGWACDFDQQNGAEVMECEFWNLGLKRPHSFCLHSFSKLLSSWKEAQAKLWNDERPCGEKDLAEQIVPMPRTFNWGHLRFCSPSWADKWVTSGWDQNKIYPAEPSKPTDLWEIKNYYCFKTLGYVVFNATIQLLS